MSKSSREKRYENKKALVTGADGLIGRALVARLSGEGAVVHAARRTDADLTDAAQTEALLRAFSPDIVFNTAARIDMSRDRAHIDDIIEGTYGMARNVMRAAEISGVKKFVQFGTIEEYGSNEAPFVETMRESPISAYSLGKTMATHEALLLSKTSGMKVCVVRPAATFGPGKRAGMLVPNFIRAALSGTDFNMNAGEQERDFIFVDDVAEASLRAALSDRTDGEIINVGSGTGMTVRGFVEALNAAMGNPITVHFGVEPYRINDTMRFFMNIDKAKRLLSWEPEVALPEALRITVEWYRANADIFGVS